MTSPSLSISLGSMSVHDDSKNDSRVCILQAATKLFAKLGLDKCSTREIAKESDSNISLISYYFGGKEGLYKEVMRHYALQIKNSVDQIFSYTEDDPLTREHFIKEISKMVDNMIELRLGNPEMSMIFSREKLTGMPFSKEVHEEVFYPLIQKFYDVFKMGQKNGFVRDDINPAFFFVTLSEGVWGFFELIECQTSINKDCGDLLHDRAEIKKQILNIYLTGVLK